MDGFVHLDSMIVTLRNIAPFSMHFGSFYCTFSDVIKEAFLVHNNSISRRYCGLVVNRAAIYLIFVPASM